MVLDQTLDLPIEQRLRHRGACSLAIGPIDGRVQPGTFEPVTASTEPAYGRQIAFAVGGDPFSETAAAASSLVGPRLVLELAAAS